MDFIGLLDLRFSYSKLHNISNIPLEFYLGLSLPRYPASYSFSCLSDSEKCVCDFFVALSFLLKIDHKILEMKEILCIAQNGEKGNRKEMQGLSKR